MWKENIFQLERINDKTKGKKIKNKRVNYPY